jgi:uncharacterized protein YutE (UPF0331/DUF86 family)
MMPSQISMRVVVDRLALIDEMLNEIRALPLADRAVFFTDRRNIWTADSCLRRSLEALLDIGRHMLAKGFAVGVSEYKEIATRLERHGVLSTEEANILRRMAGYRNRLVHFYHEISPEELYSICVHNLGDIENIRDTYRRWINTHPEKVEPDSPV